MIDYFVSLLQLFWPKSDEEKTIDLIREKRKCQHRIAEIDILLRHYERAEKMNAAQTTLPQCPDSNFR